MQSLRDNSLRAIVLLYYCLYKFFCSGPSGREWPDQSPASSGRVARPLKGAGHSTRPTVRTVGVGQGTATDGLNKYILLVH